MGFTMFRLQALHAHTAQIENVKTPETSFHDVLYPHPRKWKYDPSVLEYFVETSTKQTIKQSEVLRRQEIIDKGAAQLHSSSVFT